MQKPAAEIVAGFLRLVGPGMDLRARNSGAEV
jgi:hypothetical protein